jgi:hypothetical protein
MWKPPKGGPQPRTRGRRGTASTPERCELSRHTNSILWSGTDNSFLKGVLFPFIMSCTLGDLSSNHSEHWEKKNMYIYI